MLWKCDVFMRMWCEIIFVEIWVYFGKIYLCLYVGVYWGYSDILRDFIGYIFCGK